MKKTPIRERRLKSLYKYSENSNGRSQRELLTFLLATIPHSLVKETVEHFNIEH